MKDKMIILTKYIASWNWHILAVLFLLKAISFLIIGRREWFAGMIGVMILCETMAWKRKDEVYKDAAR